MKRRLALSALALTALIEAAHAQYPARPVRLFAAQGVQPSGSESPEAFAKFFRADFERNAKLVQLAGVKPE